MRVWVYDSAVRVVRQYPAQYFYGTRSRALCEPAAAASSYASSSQPPRFFCRRARVLQQMVLSGSIAVVCMRFDGSGWGVARHNWLAYGCCI